MEDILQAVLVHALHELLVERHQAVSIATSDPVELRIALGKLGKLGVKVSISLYFLHLDMCEVDTCRVEANVVEHLGIIG